MNKCMFLSFCLVFVLFSSCAPDLTDDVEMVYDTVKGINMWSSKSSEMTWNEAVEYCNNLTESGYSDWRLPTISELRTLIQNCSKTELGGSCGVTDNCLSWDECRNDACSGCDYDSSGKYSKLGDNVWLWSSSVQSDYSNDRWYVIFSYGRVGSYGVGSSGYVRCVR